MEKSESLSATSLRLYEESRKIIDELDDLRRRVHQEAHRENLSSFLVSNSLVKAIDLSLALLETAERIKEFEGGQHG